MKKLVGFVVKAIVVLVALVLALVLTLPLWFGPVVKAVSNAAVPKVTKTGFNLGRLSLNPYTARFELGDLQLKNPEGYPQEYAVTVGTMNFDAETASLATDVIHIEEITVKDIFVSYVTGGENRVDNFTQIQYNVAGGREKYEEAQAKREEEKSAEELKEIRGREDAQAARRDEPPAGKKPSKRFIIDRLEISGILVQYGPLPIRVPSLTLTDIGRKSDGSTLADLWEQILQAVMKSAGVGGDQLKLFGNLVGETSGRATKAVSETAGKAATAVGGTAGKAATAVGDTAGKATEGATKAVGTATKAVGEGATKALDSLKKLW